MDRLTLRQYLPGDAEAMYALDLQCFEPPFRFSRRAMRAFAEAPGALVLLAQPEADLAGFCIVQMEDHVGYVVTLDVAPARRRQGLARCLMAEMENSVRAAGGTAMELHVFSENHGAVQFYQSMGYQPMRAARGFYGRHLDALVYGKKLAEGKPPARPLRSPAANYS